MTPAQTPNADTRSSQNPPASGSSSTQNRQPGATQPSTAQSNQPASTQNNQPASAQTNQPTGQANQPAAEQTRAPVQPSTASGNQPNSPATTAQQPAASSGTNQSTAPQSGAQAPTRLSASLQTEQKTRLSQAVATLDVKPITNANFSIAVGTAVPQTVSLRPLPSTIVAVIPQYQGYNFFVVRDEIVIVEPSSHRIVDVIDRGSGGARAQSTSTTTERKLNLSSQQKEIIRKNSARRTTTTTTGSAPRTSRTITIGEEVPDSVTIESFPEEVYRDVPEIRSYRYIPSDRGMYIVDPQSRRVIDEFD
jgi:hypothetical protein